MKNPTINQQHIQISSKHTKTIQRHKPLKNTDNDLEQQTALGMGLNLWVTPKQECTLDVATEIEGTAQIRPPMDDAEYRWKVCTTLETSKPVKPNVPSAVLRATSQLRKDPSIKIVVADKNTSNRLRTI
jgi:hypothetical protein